MPTARSSIPAPLPGCTPLFDSAALREADRRAGEDHSMPSILLMERAGLATAEAVLAELVQGDSALPYVPILAVCGAAYVVAWAWLRWRS